MRTRFQERMARGEENSHGGRWARTVSLSLPRGRLVKGQRPEGL